MTVGQKRFAHELLILSHLTVDIVLGMDILSTVRFQIHLLTVLLNEEDVSVKADQPSMSLHIPAVIAKSVPFETVFSNEQPDFSEYENGRIDEFIATELSLFQENQGSARDEKPTLQDAGESRDHITEPILDMLRPAAAKHLPVALMPDSAGRVTNIMQPAALRQPTHTAVKDDCPCYL
ncbi:hypothetical protein JTB14_025416 [Gonioctena quinquepunctata]|nr:hypothetical protein JTB14_025416 [Gonioctena quinquepunctata]